MSGDYRLSSNCIINSTDGIAAGNLTGAGGTCGPVQSQCTLQIDATFVFYPGYQITLDGNYYITIGTGAIKQTYLWVTDADQDGYPPALLSKVAQDTAPAGYARQDTVASLTTYDCYDSNKSAHPGQINYFTYSRGDGSFDYNCDGTEEKQYPSTIGAICIWSGGCQQNVYSGSGWSGTVPACGGSGTFNDSAGITCYNYTISTDCYSAGQSIRTQVCR